MHSPALYKPEQKDGSSLITPVFTPTALPTTTRILSGNMISSRCIPRLRGSMTIHIFLRSGVGLLLALGAVGFRHRSLITPAFPRVARSARAGTSAFAAASTLPTATLLIPLLLLLLGELRVQKALDTLALLVPPLLELLLGLDFVEIVLRIGCFANLVLFCLLLVEDRSQRERASRRGARCCMRVRARDVSDGMNRGLWRGFW